MITSNDAKFLDGRPLSGTPADGEAYVYDADTDTWVPGSVAASGVTWANLSGKPSTFAPTSHASAHASSGNDPLISALDSRAYPLLADTLANRPAAGVAGRFFWTSDEHILYRDSGSAWVKIAVADFADLDGQPATFEPSPHHAAHDSTGGDAITSLVAGIVAAGSVAFTEISTPAAPSSGENKLYFKSDGKLYKLNSSDVEVEIASAASVPAHRTSHESGGDDALTNLPANIQFVGAGMFDQIAKPASPASGKNKLYFKSDNKVYKLDSAGNEAELAAAGAVATHHTTHETGGDDVIAHDSLSGSGTNSHSAIDTFIGSKAGVSGLASLDGSSLVVQNPANATATATASKIPIADGSGKLDTWVSDAGASTKGKIQLAGQLGGTAASPSVLGFTESGSTVLAIGTVSDGQYLKRSGTSIIGAAGSSSGGVLQVVSTCKTNTFSTNSTSFVDVTGLSVSITPSSASNKVLVTFHVSVGTNSTNSTFKLVRDSTDIAIGDAAGSRVRSTTLWVNAMTTSMTFLDSPATTSATTYKLQMKVASSSYYAGVNYSYGDTDSSTMVRGVSAITVMEIAG